MQAVCDFLRFDLRLRGTPIDFQPGKDLPACELLPDDIDELSMNLLQALAEGAAERVPGARVLLQTEMRGDQLVLRAGLGAGAPTSWPPRSRIDALERRAHNAGARLRRVDRAVEILMPQRAPAA